MKLLRFFIVIPMITSFVNAMELRNGTVVGETRYLSIPYKSAKGEFELIAAQAERIISAKGKRYFQCTVNIQRLQEACAKYRSIIIDRRINVTSDSEGNCPTVFVSMQEEHSVEFCNDPLILKYRQFSGLPEFEKAIHGS